MTTNATSSPCEAQLDIFEDNAAVIRMIIRGRSPMMRHVSRTHRVASVWLFDRINLDPKIHIKFVDTTKGSFTRDEWNHILRQFDIMDFSMFSCRHFRSIEKANTMSKRIQERKTGEKPAVATPSSTCLISATLVLTFGCF